MSDAIPLYYCTVCGIEPARLSLLRKCDLCGGAVQHRAPRPNEIYKERNCIRCRARPAKNQKALFGLCVVCLEDKQSTYLGTAVVPCILCLKGIEVKRMSNPSGSATLVPPPDVRYVNKSELTGWVHDGCYAKARVIAEEAILRRPTKSSIAGIKNRRISFEK